MSTRNLSGAESPSRSSSVSSRICSISARSLTRWLSCQRQSFHWASGTSSQIGARRLTGGRAVGSERHGRVGQVDERRLGRGAGRVLVSDRGLDLLGVQRGRASGCGRRGRPGSRLRRIKSMQSASRRMIARWSGGGPAADGHPAGRRIERPRQDRGRRQADGRDGRLLADHRPEEAHHDEEAAEQGDQADPAVGRVGAGVRARAAAPIPKTTAQTMNRNANRNLPFGLVMPRTQRSRRPRPTSPTAG